MEREIRESLDQIENDERVRVLYAVESGSRAWGFASADSDWDVRFIYARRADWYLSVQRRRDVLEYTLSNGLDMSGWDLRKALGLFAKLNPPLLEWIRSPIVYREAF
jgi:predicted nucleotidyltransferase